MQNHFELFGLPPRFALDAAELEKAYLQLQSRLHPDRFAHAGDAERRASLQWTTRVNEAYRVLRSPVQRARYLLELNGVDVGFETDTRMPQDFLVQQLELREAIEEANGKKDSASLDRIRSDLAREKAALQGEIEALVDSQRNYAGAAGLVRKLMFLERLDEEVDEALAALEA